MAWYQDLVRGLGTANAPFGFGPDVSPSQGAVDPAYNNGMQFIGNLGMGMLASGSRNPIQALGRSYLVAQNTAREQNKDSAVAAAMLQSAEDKRKEREQAAQRQQMIDEQIAKLPPELQGLARIAPEKVFGNMIDSKFAGQGGGDEPSSVREYQYARSQGFTGSYMDWKKQNGGGLALGIGPDGQLTLMPGGGGAGASGGLPGEIGARLGMGENFLQSDAPAIEPGIKAGDATGPWDYTMGVLGRGNAGVIHRRMASGADALRRGLTGSGMSASEAGDYANRYLPTLTDDADTLFAKEQSLKADLEAVKNGALAGKTGNLAAFLPGSKMFSGSATPAPTAQPKAGDVVDNEASVPEGATVVDENGVAYRKVNGKLQKVQ